MLNFAEKLDYLFKTVLRDEDGKEYTCEEAAKGTGGNISASYIWQLRNGIKSNPSMNHIHALAYFFKVPVNYFFEPVDEPKPKLSPGLKHKLSEAQTWILDFGGVLYDERFPIVSGLLRLLAHTEIYKAGISLPDILISYADCKIGELFDKKNVSEKKRDNFSDAWPIFVNRYPLGSLFPETPHLLSQLKDKKIIFLTGIPRSRSKFINESLFKYISTEPKPIFLSLDRNPSPFDKMPDDDVKKLLLEALNQSSQPIVFVDDEETSMRIAKGIDPNITCVGMTSGYKSLIKDFKSYQESLRKAGADVVFDSLFELRKVLS